MGLFLETAVILDCNETTARNALKKAENLPGNNTMEIVASECSYKELGQNTLVLLNNGCCGYAELTQVLSEDLHRPVLLLYIYDEDQWGYYFYENGKELDIFSPVPDYFQEVSEEARKRVAGNPSVISKYFHVREEDIKNYLIFWTEDVLDEDEKKAYEEDEYAIGDCWQMADFMKKIGFPYNW